MPVLKPAYSYVCRNRDFGYQFSFVYKKDDDKLMRTGRDLAEALAFIHRLGFVHHDVRPENILQDDAGNFVLADIDAVRPLKD